MQARFLKVYLLSCFSCICFTGIFSNALNAQPVAEISSLKFLGLQKIPYGLQFEKTTVGGLSGIDYDAGNKIFYLICDDRSAINPARFYKASIGISKKGIDSVRFTAVDFLLQPNGHTYPNSDETPSKTPDPEAMRYDPVRKQLVWSSEGERIISSDTVLANPEINIVSTTGKYKSNYPLPGILAMQASQNGPRQNGVLEGMSFADKYTSLYVSVEEPLYEDGPPADTMDNNAFIRILKFDVGSKKNTSQYAYKLDPVAHPAFPANAFKINGVPDILSIGKNKLLVIERSFSSGRLACTIKLFIADLAGATDIKNIPSLKDAASYTQASKKLLMNMDDLGIYIDNVEGVTFGPTLSNGHQTLVFVADNNFNPLEQSQVILFEVIP